MITIHWTESIDLEHVSQLAVLQIENIQNIEMTEIKILKTFCSPFTFQIIAK